MAHFDNRIEDYMNKIDGYLESILPIKTIPPTDLHEAMHYAVMTGGKRMRPLLVYATGETLGIDSDYLTLLLQQPLNYSTVFLWYTMIYPPWMMTI